MGSRGGRRRRPCGFPDPRSNQSSGRGVSRPDGHNKNNDPGRSASVGSRSSRILMPKLLGPHDDIAAALFDLFREIRSGSVQPKAFRVSSLLATVHAVYLTSLSIFVVPDYHRTIKP